VLREKGSEDCFACHERAGEVVRDGHVGVRFRFHSLLRFARRGGRVSQVRVSQVPEAAAAEAD
jgi:hypothetical protein